MPGALLKFFLLTHRPPTTRRAGSRFLPLWAGIWYALLTIFAVDASFAATTNSPTASHKTRPTKKDTAKKTSTKPTREAAAPAVAEQKETDLKQIRERIESIRQNIEADSTKRDALAGELQAAETTIRSARDQGEEIRKQRQASEQRMRELKAEQAATEERIAKQRAVLADQLRAAYMNGREEQLKLLLNQQDPAAVGRTLAYYGYFGKARAAQIAAINERLAHLKTVATDIQAETDRLRSIEDKHQAQLQELAKARAKRAQTLASIQSKLKSRGEELTVLQKQAATLERLLTELRNAVDDFPSFGRQPFENLKGKLPWPIKGKIASRFGELRAGGPLKWEGIVIDAEPNSQVRAPLAGRVVYADWLNGLGYLVVLDHGGGYLSLYGHNEQLYRKVGDTVNPGDVLGDLGDRGDKAQLYMEIRKVKTPLDPLTWLRKP